MTLSAYDIIEALPYGLLITNATGGIELGSQVAADMLGADPASLPGMTLYDLLTSEDSAVLDALQAAASGGLPRPIVREFGGGGEMPTPIEISFGVLADGRVLLLLKNLTEEMRLLNDLQRRNAQLIASSEVSKAATQILEPQELLLRCVDLIRTHFGFYYAAIFLVDEVGEWAVLRAATGDAGHTLMQKGHRLGVGSQSMVGWVTANNAARIALDVGEEAIRFDNPLLPKTRSEMALPLTVRGEVIGALDVQSTALNAFTPEDIKTIQMMADQVAIAIENARLFAARGA